MKQGHILQLVNTKTGHTISMRLHSLTIPITPGCVRHYLTCPSELFMWQDAEPATIKDDVIVNFNNRNKSMVVLFFFTTSYEILSRSDRSIHG